MSLPLSIGKNSLNQLIMVDVCSLPHLFVAYSYDEQLPTFLKHCITTINQANDIGSAITIALALGNRNSFLLDEISCPIAFAFVPDCTNEITNQSANKDAFIKQLFTEMKGRIKQLKQNIKKARSSPLLIVIIDELFRVILSDKKQTGIYFLQLLILGKEVGIHFIAASTSTYRSLLPQLMNMHPEVEKQLTQKQLTKNCIINKPLCAELVITLDDLVFYKSMNMQIHERFFCI